jgi:hypothetical protein
VTGPSPQVTRMNRGSGRFAVQRESRFGRFLGQPILKVDGGVVGPPVTRLDRSDVDFSVQRFEGHHRQAAGRNRRPPPRSQVDPFTSCWFSDPGAPKRGVVQRPVAQKEDCTPTATGPPRSLWSHRFHDHPGAAIHRNDCDMESETRSAKSWSADERRHALELAAEHGPTDAAELTGIPVGTILSWRHRLARAAVAAAEVVQRDTGRTWDERRDRIVIDLADTFDLARAKLHAALDTGTTKAARDLVIVVGVLGDKCELLSGGVTSRHESYSLRADVDLEAMRREIAENEAKLAALEVDGG